MLIHCISNHELFLPECLRVFTHYLPAPYREFPELTVSMETRLQELRIQPIQQDQQLIQLANE